MARMRCHLDLYFETRRDDIYATYPSVVYGITATLNGSNQVNLTWEYPAGWGLKGIFSP